MQYLRARYYDPRVGRFNRLDPFAGKIDDPLSLHKYLYAHVDPVQFADPSGLTATLSGQLSVLGNIGSLMSNITFPSATTLAKVGIAAVTVATVYQLGILLQTDVGVVTTGTLSDELLQDIVDQLARVDVNTLAKTLALLRDKRRGLIYFHYSYVTAAPSLVGSGLIRRPGAVSGPYATWDVYTDGTSAKFALSLPRIIPPDSVYIVRPKVGFFPVGPTIVAPAIDLGGKLMPGGGTEFVFSAAGSGGPGTVFGPVPLFAVGLVQGIVNGPY